MPSLRETRAPAVPRDERGLALAAALVTVVFWASAFVGIRDAGEHLSPGALALGRLLVACAVLGAFVLARREPLPPRSAVPAILVAGVLWLGVYNLALNAAERRIDAGTAAMLVNVGPILIAVLAGLLLGEGFPRRLVTGCAIAFAGVVVIGLATGEGGLALGTGAILCLVAAAAYAAGVVAQKPALGRVSPLQLTFLCCVVGALVCLPFAPSLASEASDAPASALAWVAYLGVFPTGLAFTTWAYALKRTTAGRLGATTYLVPPIAILLGWLLLGESPPTLAFAGGVACLAGVAVARSAGGTARLRARRGRATAAESSP
jgi:drug/metabolite transporter (DMT)-like permease